MGKQNLITIEFHGHQLETFKDGGTEWVSVRSIASGIGLDVQAQQRKLQRKQEKFSCSLKAVTASDGKQYQTYCIPVKKVPGWLFTIDPDRVKPEIKESVEIFQEECFDALYDYWHGGKAEQHQARNESALPDMTEKHFWLTLNSSGGVVRQVEMDKPETVAGLVHQFFGSLLVLSRENTSKIARILIDRVMGSANDLLHVMCALEIRGMDACDYRDKRVAESEDIVAKVCGGLAFGGAA